MTRCTCGLRRSGTGAQRRRSTTARPFPDSTLLDAEHARPPPSTAISSPRTSRPRRPRRPCPAPRVPRRPATVPRCTVPGARLGTSDPTGARRPWRGEPPWPGTPPRLPPRQRVLTPNPARRSGSDRAPSRSPGRCPGRVPRPMCPPSKGGAQWGTVLLTVPRARWGTVGHGEERGNNFRNISAPIWMTRSARHRHRSRFCRRERWNNRPNQPRGAERAPLFSARPLVPCLVPIRPRDESPRGRQRGDALVPSRLSGSAAASELRD